MIHAQVKLVEWRPDRVDLSVEQRLGELFAESGQAVESSARTSLVERSRRSLPGETPTSITGLLRDGVVHESSPEGMMIGVVDNQPRDVPFYLEQQRPFLAPALEREIPQFMRQLEDSVR